MSEHIQLIPAEELIPSFEMAALSETEHWGILTNDIAEAHNKATGKGIVIAVLDTGGPNHIDLNDNLLPAHNASSSQVSDDKIGHSSHASGIIAALQNGFGIVGVAPNAKITPVKVLDDKGLADFDHVEQGIKIATNLKVDVISMSLGAPVEPPKSLHTAIKAATEQGIIIVAAAGNDSGAVNWPARYDEVIAVAAIDDQGNLAKFSSRGAEVSVVAPGVSVYSTWLNNLYATLSGTSQATPFVAGIIALLLEWSRTTHGARPISNYIDMLQYLDEISDHQGRIGLHGKTGVTGFGIPEFANFKPWK